MKVHLDQIRIASPCNADWNAMEGDDQSRFCGLCEKRVYNLTAMSQVEAEKFLRDMEGKACVKLYQRPDGTLLTQDCPVGRQRVRKRLAATTVSSVAALMAGLAVIFPGRGRSNIVEKLNVENGQVRPFPDGIDLVDHSVQLAPPDNVSTVMGIISSPQVVPLKKSHRRVQ